jgi:hypothetical protein
MKVKMSLDNFEEKFKNGTAINQEIAGLTGRIIRGKKTEDFETLTNDPKRKLVMLMGGDGLASICGKKTLDALVLIGYTKDYIQHRVSEGYQFKLVIFKESNNILLATWDNVLEMVGRVYGKDVAIKVGNRLLDMKNLHFSAIQDMNKSFDLEEIYREGSSSPRYMTAETFEKSQGTAFDVRAFLYHAVHLSKLFSGDGYTYDEQGKRGLKEYIVPNKKLEDLGTHVVIDLDIDASN